ncbi:MAG: protein kinase domain-containing protein [Casimicrobium sp.]
MTSIDLQSQQWRVVSALVDVALELDPPARQSWFVTDEKVAALDEVARAQLRSLIDLSNAPETRDFLTELPQVEARPSTADRFAMGDAIGPYRLLARLGEGGMAEVWRAARDDGAYRRDVALKLPFVQSGAAREMFAKRSERERDVLARLEHPNIARFYDAGVAQTRLGLQPYLVLELIDGDPITTHADKQKLSIDARCQLMQQVLRAVQFAHQRFVVHRDLKPSNILVRSDGSVALLDFGIAKLLDSEATSADATQLTRDTGRAVTLAYASPEQLLGESITTASDVYSAGIIFFELLSGERPFGGADRNLGTLLQALNAQTPSITSVLRDKLRNDAASYEANNAAMQTIEARERALRGDLSSIVSKAMRRDATARYETAAAFDEDIARYLGKLPVRAREGAWLYHVQKFFARQRVPIAVGALGIAIAAGSGIVALTQRANSQANQAQAVAVQSLIDSLFAGMSPDLAETRTYTTKELLDRARQALPASSDTESAFAVKLRFADLYRSIGEYKDAEALYESLASEARAGGDGAREASVLVQHALVKSDQFDFERANALLAQAETLSRTSQLDALTLAQIDYANGLRVLNRGEYAEATALLTGARSKADAIKGRGTQGAEVAALSTQMLAQVHALEKRTDDARASFAEASRRFAQLGSKYTSAQLNVGVLRAMHEHDEANYARALSDLQLVKPALDRRYPPEHSVRILGDYVQAASELYSGQFEAARVSIDRYARGAANNADHAPLAERLSVYERMYSGDFASALAKLSQLQKKVADSGAAGSDTQRGLLARLRAEILLRAGQDAEAIRELNALLGLASTSTPENERLKAYAELTLAVAELRASSYEKALRRIESVVPVVERQFGERDTARVSMYIYRAWAEARAGNRAIAIDKAAVDAFLAANSWQQGSAALLARIRGEVSPGLLPVIM